MSCDRGYELSRPDLIIHESLFSLIPIDLKFKLTEAFNLVYPPIGTCGRDCQLKKDYTYRPEIISSPGVDKIILNSCLLEPHYHTVLSRESGSSPLCTSYDFDELIELYRYNKRGPRYVMWPPLIPLG